MSSESGRGRLVREMRLRSTSDGEAERYDAFFRAVLPRAVAVARRVTGDRAAAEDAAVEALAKAHFRWTRVGALERPDLWVIKVAAREARPISAGASPPCGVPSAAT
jgi:DNA-directed RNA polymerase specialized sigma24 family protein